MKALTVTESWDESIVRRQKVEQKTTYFSISSNQESLEFLMASCYPDKLLEEFCIEFTVNPKFENSKKDENRVICQCNDFEDCENLILTVLLKIRTWFEVEIRGIEVNLDLGFNLEFMKKLRLDKIGHFTLSGDKKCCQIDSKELVDLINGWCFWVH